MFEKAGRVLPCPSPNPVLCTRVDGERSLSRIMARYGVQASPSHPGPQPTPTRSQLTALERRPLLPKKRLAEYFKI